MTQNIFIWWVSQSACEAIGSRLPSGLPKYVRDQYRSRLGRPGRCRLWSAPQFEDFGISPWPKNSLTRWLELDDCGGIVIGSDAIDIISKLPGVITDPFLVKR